MKKIVLVDDSATSLKRTTSYVERKGSYEILAVLQDGYELVKYCNSQRLLPDIVLLDVMMPRFDGVSTMEYLNTHFPTIRTIALSSFIDDKVVFDMMAAGALGYVVKDPHLSVLAEALSAIEGGFFYVDPRLRLSASDWASITLTRQQERERSFASFRVNKREKEILGLIVANLDYVQIGEILHVAPKTVENIVTNLVKKMCITNGRSGLLLQSVRLGMTKIMSPGQLL